MGFSMTNPYAEQAGNGRREEPHDWNQNWDEKVTRNWDVPQ
jgi:hypothetical protein